MVSKATIRLAARLVRIEYLSRLDAKRLAAAQLGGAHHVVGQITAECETLARARAELDRAGETETDDRLVA